jgi:hypothetical protein
MSLNKRWIIRIAVVAFLALLQSVIAQEPVQLIVAKDGEGAGMVISSPPGIECGDEGSSCTATFGSGTPFNLSPKETTGASVFEGWSQTSGSTTHCEGTNGPCSFIIGADSSLRATFAISTQVFQ